MRRSLITVSLLAIVRSVLSQPAWSAPGDPSRSGIVPPAVVKPPISISGEIALASLVALSDGHLQKMADSLAILPLSSAVRGGSGKENGLAHGFPMARTAAAATDSQTGGRPR